VIRKANKRPHLWRYYSSATESNNKNQPSSYRELLVQEAHKELVAQYGKENVPAGQNADESSTSDYKDWTQERDAMLQATIEIGPRSIEESKRLREKLVEQVQQVDTIKKLAQQGDFSYSKLSQHHWLNNTEKIDPMIPQNDDEAKTLLAADRKLYLHNNVEHLESLEKSPKNPILQEVYEQHDPLSVRNIKDNAFKDNLIQQFTEMYLSQGQPRWMEDKKAFDHALKIGREPPGRVEFKKIRFRNKAKWRFWARQQLSGVRMQQRMKSFYEGEAWYPDQEMEVFHHGISDIPEMQMNKRTKEIHDHANRIREVLSGRYDKLRAQVQRNIVKDEFAKRGIETYRDYYNYRLAQEYSLFNHHWNVKKGNYKKQAGKGGVDFTPEQEEEFRKQAIENIRRRKETQQSASQ